jgi:hypothetical protein
MSHCTINFVLINIVAIKLISKAIHLFFASFVDISDSKVGQATQWSKEEGQATQWPKEGQATQYPKQEGQATIYKTYP